MRSCITEHQLLSGESIYLLVVFSSLVSKTAHIPGRDCLPVLLNIIKQTCRYCSNLSASSQLLNLQNVRLNPVQITPQDSKSSPCSVETFQYCRFRMTLSDPHFQTHLFGSLQRNKPNILTFFNCSF